FSSRRRHTRSLRDWSSDVCSSDLHYGVAAGGVHTHAVDEFAHAEIRRQGEKSALRRIPAFRRRVLSEDTALVSRPSPHHPGDLCAHASLDLRFLSSSWARLDSRG